MSWQDQVAKKRSEVLARIPVEWTEIIDSVVATADPSSNVLALILNQLLTPEQLEITLKNASQLIPAMQSGELSSEKVVTAFAKKTAAVAKLTNAVSEPLYSEAINRARELDTLPKDEKLKLPLFGLPITVKDSFNVPGVQSTLGTVSRIALPPASKASPAVALLTDRLGAIVIAKTNVPQAIITPESHNNVFGRTLNPANPKEWGSGGSSGGEGVLVSQRASALGLGTDLAGSIRVPAWSNGAYGYKPSLKIVPYLGFEDAGKPPREPGLTATVGPLAQSADDLELFLKSVIGARPWEDPELENSLEPIEWKEDHHLPETFTVGILTGSPGVPITSQVQETVRLTAEKLGAAGHKLVWIDEAAAPSISDLTQQVGVPLISLDTDGTHLEAIRRGGEPLTPETARGHTGLFEPHIEKNEQDGSEQVFVAKVIPFTVSDEDLAKSKTLQGEFIKAWDDLFTAHKLDALMCPLIDEFAPAHGKFDLTPFAINWNTVDVSKMLGSKMID